MAYGGTAEEQKVKRNQYQRERRIWASPEGWRREALRSARRRAREKDLLFNLTLDDIKLPERCPVFGTRFVFGVKAHPHSPTLDRMVPAAGYVSGNVRVISRRANMLKSDVTDPRELEAVAAYIRQL